MRGWEKKCYYRILEPAEWLNVVSVLSKNELPHKLSHDRCSQSGLLLTRGCVTAWITRQYEIQPIAECNKSKSAQLQLWLKLIDLSYVKAGMEACLRHVTIGLEKPSYLSSTSDEYSTVYCWVQNRTREDYSQCNLTMNNTPLCQVIACNHVILILNTLFDYTCAV